MAGSETQDREPQTGNPVFFRLERTPRSSQNESDGKVATRAAKGCNCPRGK